MDALSFQNQLFNTYAIVAALTVLKAHGMSWLTVARMIQENAGMRSPEDIRATPMNPTPDPSQLLPNDRVDRIRRIQLNDLESLPYFLVTGFLFILTKPSLLVAQIALYGYFASRMLHFYAYLTARTHDTRAKLWTVGAMFLLAMIGRTLWCALTA
jgi:glutathione S-transferase